MRKSREFRAERLYARAAATSAEADRLFTKGSHMASFIPFGQPILVGHYSEKRDRNYRRNIGATFHRASEMVKTAEDLNRRAKAAENNTTIYADDIDPISAIDAKIAVLEAERKDIKARDHREWELANIGANIRRLKQRREELAKIKTAQTTETITGSVRVVENVELVRIQLFFNGKPEEAVRACLKASGFRWAPSLGAWQRQLNNSGRYAAKQVVKTLSEKGLL